MVSFCGPVGHSLEWFTDRCFQLFPCLSDPGIRFSWGLKLALVVLHVVFVGVLFLFDGDLIEKTRKEPWYTTIYLALFVATLAQYFITSASSPGYVIDAMRAWDETHATINKPAKPSRASEHWTCTYCYVVQPPRAKHCHDCDKCVLQFDHHCVCLGTCVGQGNHCRYWWYIFEETLFCIWTGILYITFLKANTTRQWWKDAVVILLLIVVAISFIFVLLLLLFHSYLILTNQTTYEIVRRRRISYLRAVPERAYPFSRGICRNLYNFCFARSGIYAIEPLPTAQEL